MALLANYSDLAEKTFLVTGVTRGIGRDIALNLAEQKAHVVFNYRAQSESLVSELQEQITNLGGKSTALCFDIGNASEVKSALEAFLKAGNTIHGIVNNAGIVKDQLLMRVSDEDLDTTFDVNIKGAFYVTRALNRSLLRVPGGASIVNISSVVGLSGNAGQSVYAASKAALIGFTKSLAKELASKNIRCNAVCPGCIATNMTQELPEKIKENYLANIPLKRFGQGEEVANLVSFLLSGASSYINGEVIKIDGGLYI